MRKPLMPEPKGLNSEIQKFMTIDIEAQDWINFVCAGFYNGDTNEFQYQDNLIDMTMELMSYCKKHDIENVFAHNGGKYDFNFFFSSMLFNDEIIVYDIIPRGSGILCFSISPVVTDSDGITSQGSQKIIFRDSLALLPFGLASLAKSFKVPVLKGNIDYDFIKPIWDESNYRNIILNNPDKYKILSKIPFKYLNIDMNTEHGLYTKDDLIHYLKDDLVSLWQCLDTFFNWEVIKDAGVAFTTAGQALKVLQNYIDRPISRVKGGSKTDKFIRKAYYGGRTEVFKSVFDNNYNIKLNKHKFNKLALTHLEKQKGVTLNYYDVNSLYPTVMRDNDYPNKSLGPTRTYESNMMGIWHCKVSVPEDTYFPFIGVKRIIDGSEKLVFPVGEFECHITNVEIEYAKTQGVKILEVFEGYVFSNGGKIFSKFITTLYDMRLEAKKKKDSVADTLTKLIMNSCYGRFGLNTEREKLVIDNGEGGLKFHSEIIDPKSQQMIRFATKPTELKSFTNVAIPCFVTAYARILMHKIFLESGKDNTYYTDTDSIFTTKTFPTGNALGQVKLEYSTKAAVFLLPKTYINEGVEGESFNKKVTMKGFDKKKIKHFTHDDFIEHMRGECVKLKIIQPPKFATMKTAINMGTFLAMTNDPETRKKQVYIKNIKLKEELIEQRYMLYLFFDEIPISNCNILKNSTLSSIQRIDRKLEKIDEELIKPKTIAPSTREIKASYNKRMIIDDGFDTKPIILKE